jgi:hypothetical protein
MDQGELDRSGVLQQVNLHVQSLDDQVEAKTAAKIGVNTFSSQSFGGLVGMWLGQSVGRTWFSCCLICRPKLPALPGVYNGPAHNHTGHPPHVYTLIDPSPALSSVLFESLLFTNFVKYKCKH